MPRPRGTSLADLSDAELAAVMPLLEDVQQSVKRLSPAQRRLYRESQDSVVAAKRLVAGRSIPPPPAR